VRAHEKSEGGLSALRVFLRSLQKPLRRGGVGARCDRDVCEASANSKRLQRPLRASLPGFWAPSLQAKIKQRPAPSTGFLKHGWGLNPWNRGRRRRLILPGRVLSRTARPMWKPATAATIYPREQRNCVQDNARPRKQMGTWPSTDWRVRRLRKDWAYERQAP
jgi:hypothetical protein